MRPMSMSPVARLALGLLLSAVAVAQDGGQSSGAPPAPPSPPGQSGTPALGSREATWPAPTAEDWKKPCLITWQRTYEDALAVSRETKKPILVCINMDGEIASEHYAGVRYRQPEIAKLYEPYVTVIASVYRHNLRDYDEQGNRILCPRFGSVTCGEHIAIEPGLFEKFMDGKRIAPRHIGVELDSAEMYDVYYAWDTDTIFNSLREGIAERKIQPEPFVRGDRPILERVPSADIVDRTAVESAYRSGDPALRRTLLQAATAQGAAAPVDLLRLAILGLDLENAKLARHALAQSSSESAIDLIAEALKVPMEGSEREALVAALVRLGGTYPRARTLAAVHQGLAGRASVVDVEDWSKTLGQAVSPAAPERAVYESQLDAEARVLQAGNAQEALELAEAYLALAVDAIARPKAARLLFEDARRVGREAEKLQADRSRVSAVLAIAASNLGDWDDAYARAETAVGAMPPDPRGWNAMAVLELFAQARQRGIAKAVREKQEWPAQWLTDVHAAYSVLSRHPLGNDGHVVAHYDFLRSLGAGEPAARVLDEGLSRFPDSWVLHDRLRTRILQEKGLEGLETAYEARLREVGAHPTLEWFAGYASLVTAEFHRRAGRADAALAAYDRAMAHYERSIANVPTSRETADHYVAVAHAGRARIAYERGDSGLALSELVASFDRKPDAAASLDGLNISAVDTAKMLRARLVAANQTELAATLQAGLDKLDPRLLELPAYENEGPNGTSADGRPPRRRRPQSER
jgi:tetratricopeptide (TPR) repeat protein